MNAFNQFQGHDGVERILLVEDDAMDVAAVRRAFEDNGVDIELVVRKNGQDALSALQSGAISKHGLLVLLDLNMPKMNGIDFLRALRRDEELRRTPVVGLTSSARPEDKEAAYDAHVAGYLVKPLDYDECVTLLGALADYWRVVQLP